MKIRYYICLVLGSIAGFIQLVGVPLTMNKPDFSLGDNTAEKIGGVIGLMLFGIVSFLFFRGAYIVNRKIKDKMQKAEFNKFLSEE